MEHNPLEHLVKSADIYQVVPCQVPMSQRERLLRWTELLDREPDRRLKPLLRIEYQSGRVRDELRRDTSPISVAFADPVLRAAGLANDSYGEAKRFFRLTDWQLHYILCDCHVGASIRARFVAARLRHFVPGSSEPGLFARVLRLFGR